MDGKRWLNEDLQTQLRKIRDMLASFAVNSERDNPRWRRWKSNGVAKMTSHAIFQYNVLAIDDTHNTWTNTIVKIKHSQAFRFK